MTDFIKPTPEAFQFMVRYSDIAKVKIDLNDVAKVMGSKYKAAWDGFDKAKKHLASTGYVAPPPDASAGDNGVTIATKGNGNGTKAAAKGPNGKKRKSAEKSGQEDGRDDAEEVAIAPKAKRGRPSKTVKREESEEAVNGGVSGDLADRSTSAVAEKKKRAVSKKKQSAKNDESAAENEDASDDGSSGTEIKNEGDAEELDDAAQSDIDVEAEADAEDEA